MNNRTTPNQWPWNLTRDIRRRRRGAQLPCGVVTKLWVVSGLLLALSVRAAAPSVTTLGAYRDGLQAPTHVAADAAGSIYVTDTQAGQVAVFDAFGRLAYVIPGFSGPLGIAVDSQGRIYLAEEGRGSVSVFDRQWNPLFKLGRGDREFALPNYLASGGAAVYVSDSKAHQVKVYREGVFQFSFGGLGTNTAQFDFPTGLFVGANDEVFVVDQNNDRAQVFSLDGDFLRAFSLVTPLPGMGLGSSGGRSQGIVGDAQGRLFVADSFQGFVRVFDVQGNYLAKIGSLGDLPGQLATPMGMALDGYGRLFVASLNNSRLEVLGLDSFVQLAAAPARQLVPAGTNVSFSVLVSDPELATFQWRKGTNNLADGGQVHGANGPVLTLAGVTPADSGQYSVQVDEPGNVRISPPADLTVRVPPAIASFTSNRTAIAGTNVTFAVSAAGDDLSYRWFFRGYEIVGATGPALALTNIQPINTGAYSVLAYNPVGAAASPDAYLTVLIPPGAPTIESTTFLRGGGVQLTVNGDMGYDYWIDGGSNLVEWVVLTNIVNPTGSLEVVLPQAAHSPNWFYRLRWSP